MNPKYVKALLRRAGLFEEKDKPHEAMKDYQAVLEVDPKHAQSLVAVNVRLPPIIKKKDEELKAEMMGMNQTSH